MFNPSRLTIARERCGLSRRDLAERAGVAPFSLSGIENGRKNPNVQTVRNLAKALEFPEAFFSRGDIERPAKEAASFRGMVTMTARERGIASSAARLAYEIQDWVEERFSPPQHDLVSIPPDYDPENASLSLRNLWALGQQPISNMLNLMESKGFKVFSLAEETLRFDSYSCWRGGTPYIFLNTFKLAECIRFDCAHELGHLLLHRHGGPRSARQAESEANCFAYSFLMPESDIRARVRSLLSVNDLVKAKKRWGVSAASLAYRLYKLEIISDFIYSHMNIEMTKRRYFANEPNPIPHEKSVVWEKVLAHLWGKGLTKHDIAKDLDIPPIEIEKLLFGLLQAPSNRTLKPERKKPELRIVSTRY